MNRNVQQKIESFGDTTKRLISEKLKLTLESEGLSNKEAGGILGIMPQYLSMMKNPEFWKNVSKKNWKLVNDWRNSGVPLRYYSSDLTLLEIPSDNSLEPVQEASNVTDKPVDVHPYEETSEKINEPEVIEESNEGKSEQVITLQTPIEKDEEVLALMIENEELRRELDFYKSEIKDLKVLLANFRNENYEAKNTILTEMRRYNTLVIDLLNKQKPVNVIVQSGSQA
jgi:hypothetical protein